jgi:NitT/TauT family transport system substrate-binding protein
MQSMADAVAMVKKGSAKTLRDETGHDRVQGAFGLAVIRDYVNAMTASGEFATRDIPLDDIFSNALVPDFAKFDRAALVARARAAH